MLGRRYIIRRSDGLADNDDRSSNCAHANGVSDFLSNFGGFNTLVPAQFTGWGARLPMSACTTGCSRRRATRRDELARILCKKTVDFQSFATTNSLTVHSLYRLNDPGIWADFGHRAVHTDNFRDHVDHSIRPETARPDRSRPGNHRRRRDHRMPERLPDDLERVQIRAICSTRPVERWRASR